MTATTAGAATATTSRRRALGVRFTGLRRLGARGVVGLSAFALIVVLCIAAPLLTSESPTAMNVRAVFQSPSASHRLGADELGRDVMARVLYSGRKTLLLAFLTTVFTVSIGGVLGVLAGYLRGAVDFTISRVLEVAVALPSLILAIALVSVLGKGDYQVVIAMTIVLSPYFARVVRGEVIRIADSGFVVASRGLGERGWRILLNQIVPNISSALAVQTAMVFSYSMLAEASLSFLGLGTQPPLPSWGRILTDAIPIAGPAPWVGLTSGLAIVSTVASLGLLADGLRDLAARNRGAR